MNMWKTLRRMMMVLAVMFCLGGAAAPTMTAYADTPAVQETQAVQTAQDQGAEDDGAVLLILGGGLLLIILFAVIAAVSSVSAAVAVAANMDVDGE